MEKTYLCIDLKTFYASVECVERGLDPFTTKLVVADPARCETTICLAISPAMKELGIHNRCRVFEIPKSISYIMAKPRMKKYMEYSANIYAIYLKYISKEDIYVYSIDECFLDITNYMSMYNMTPKELAKRIMDDVYQTTGITATAGIGPNLFLTKVALDVTAKHVEDHMGYLDLEEFKKTIWYHKPITDIWQIGRGIAKRLEKYGIYDLYGVAHANPELLYKEFGQNAEYLIDHSNGIEPTTIEEIKAYTPENTSYSTHMILATGYSYKDATLALKELVEIECLNLVDRGIVCGGIGLMTSYKEDGYKITGDSIDLKEYTNSYKKLSSYFMELWERNTRKGVTIRGIGISFFKLEDEVYRTIDLFTDEKQEEKENTLSHTIVGIKKKYGKNSILKGMNLEENAIARERNSMIGGHNSE